MRWHHVYIHLHVLAIVLFLLFYSVWAYSQSIQSLPTTKDNYTRFIQFTKKKGLCSDNVLNILEDKYGIMWFATTNGLTKYDGHLFTHYHAGTSPNGLSDNVVTSIVEDIYGNIWIGTARGLNRYDRRNRQFVKYFAEHLSTAFPNDHVKALYADREGRLWIESEQGYLSCLQIKKMKWNSVRHAAGVQEGDYYYWHIFPWKNYLWIGGRAIGCQKVSMQNINRIKSNIPNRQYRDIEGSCFAETFDGQLICPSNGFIQTYQPQSGLFNINCSIPIESTCAILGDDGSVWIGGSSGLLHVDKYLQHGILYKENIENASSLLSSQINCLCKSRDGNIWIGTDKGVCLYSRSLNKIRLYCSLPDKESSLSSNKISALMQDRDGLLWVGTNNNGWSTLSLKDETIRNYKYNLLSQKINRATFYKERNTLNQYALHGFIHYAQSKEIPHFTTYESFKRTGLTFTQVNENIVSTFYQDKKGEIYIGLWSHVGFNVYDKSTGEFKRYALWDLGLPGPRPYPHLFLGSPFGSNWYAGFLEDRYGRFWCATWEGLGLNLFDRNKGMFLGKHYMINNVPHFPRGRIKRMDIDRQSKRIYLSYGLYAGYYDYARKVFRRFGEKYPNNMQNASIINSYSQYCNADLLPFDIQKFDIIQVAGNNRKQAYLCSQSSIDRLTVSNNKLETIYSQDGDTILFFDMSRDKKILFVAFRDKVRIIDAEDHLHHRITLNLKGYTIMSLHQDKDRQLWIGTDKCLFLYNLKDKTLRMVKDLHKKNYKDVNAITSDSNGTVIISCSKDLSFIHNTATYHSYIFPKNLQVGNIISDIYSESNHIWISTNDGLVRLDRESKTMRTAVYRHDHLNPHSLLDNTVLTTIALTPQILWVATESGICILHIDTGIFEDMNCVGNDCLTSRLSSCIMQDHYGNIWQGTTQEGVNVLHCQQDTIEHIVHHDWDKRSLPDNCINCIFEDSQHKMWIGTNRGLCFRSIKNHNTFIAPENLKDYLIMAVIEDQSHRLWVSTNKGLLVMDLSGKILRRFFDYHGLQDNSFSSAACKLSDGRLAFGGNYGLNIFSPNELMQTIEPKPIVFSQFYIRDSLKYEDLGGIRSIHLSAHENSFSVDFCSTDYEFGLSLLYRYRLKGFDSKWIYTKAPNLTVKYTNLSPGEYSLVVEVSNPFGEWNGKAHTLHLIIGTPWYLSWWFLSLAILCFITIILLTMYFRERVLRQRNAQLEKVVQARTEKLKEMVDSKNRFFNIISHDLKAPVYEMEMYTANLYNSFSDKSEEEKKKGLYIVWNTAKQTSSLLQKLLLWSLSQKEILTVRKQYATLYDLIAEVAAPLQPLFEEKDLTLNYEIDKALTAYTDTNMLSTILRNLLSNAIKFSFRGGLVILEAIDKDGLILLSVQDNGVGISEERKEKLFRVNSKFCTRGTEGEHGTGLGFIVVKEFVSRLEESLYVESESGRGTKITITLHKHEKNESNKGLAGG